MGGTDGIPSIASGMAAGIDLGLAGPVDELRLNDFPGFLSESVVIHRIPTGLEVGIDIDTDARVAAVRVPTASIDMPAGSLLPTARHSGAGCGGLKE
jgi:hypothetical protein